MFDPEDIKAYEAAKDRREIANQRVVNALRYGVPIGELLTEAEAALAEYDRALFAVFGREKVAA